MEALKAFEFGNLIAFVLPGLVATRVLAYFHPSIKTALDKVSAGGDGAVAPLIFLFLIAAAAGLAISVVRQTWVDKLFSGIYGCIPTDGVTGAAQRRYDCVRASWSDKTSSREYFARADIAIGRERRRAVAQLHRPPTSPDYSIIGASNDLMAQFDKFVLNIYRYYQYVGNMGLSIGLLAVTRALLSHYAVPNTVEPEPHRYVTLGLFALSMFLMVTSYFRYEAWCNVHNEFTAGERARSKARAAAAAQRQPETASSTEPPTATGAR